MLTPLGRVGIKTFPDEAAVVTAVRASVQESGLYMFPAPKSDGTPMPTDTTTGILMLQRHGNANVTPQQLGAQLVTDMAAMILVALVLTRLAPGTSFGAQWLLVTLMAVFTFLRGGVPLWNWYGYPKKMVAAGFFIELVGFAIAGAVLARLLRSRSKTTAAAS